MNDDGHRPDGLDTIPPQAESDGVSIGVEPFGTPINSPSTLGPLIQENIVRSTLSEEENQLTQDHHLGGIEDTPPTRVAGLEPGRGSAGPDRPITGELDRALDNPDHNVTRDEVEAEPVLPGRGRS
jgi:hypothetical protein